MRRLYRCGSSMQLYPFRQIAEKADHSTLVFTSITNLSDCLHQLLPLTRCSHMPPNLSCYPVAYLEFGVA